MRDQLEKFTEQARRAFVRAYEEAARRGQNIILPEHLALELIREPKEIGAQVIERLSGSLDKPIADLVVALGRAAAAEEGMPRLSPATEKAIELAVDEARRLNHKRIGTGHLVLGLLREGTLRAAIQLAHPRSVVHRARAEVLRLGEDASITSTVAGPAPGPFRDRFDKFTERARNVLALAQEEALRFHHNYIGTEHLLLGLVREGDGVAAKVLATLGIELVRVRSRVESVIGRGDRMIMGQIGLTPRAKKVVELAVEEARRLRHPYVDTEHLLLGLVREGEGIAVGVLESLGVGLDVVRAQVIRVVSQSPTYSRHASERETPTGATSGSGSETERVSNAPAEPVTEPLRGQTGLGELVRVVPIAQSAQIQSVRVTLLSLELYEGGFVFNGSVTPQAAPWTLFLAKPILRVTDDRGTEYRSTPAPSRGAVVYHSWRFIDRFSPAVDHRAGELRIQVIEIRRLYRSRSIQTTDVPMTLQEPWIVVVPLESEQAPPLSS
jgi:hypothetical protein